MTRQLCGKKLSSILQKLDNSLGFKYLLSYSKSKLELNLKKLKLEWSQKIFVWICIFFFLHLKPDFRDSSLSFVRYSWGRKLNKPAINWQNIAQVGLQLKFAFRILPLVSVLV